MVDLHMTRGHLIEQSVYCGESAFEDGWSLAHLPVDVYHVGSPVTSLASTGNVYETFWRNLDPQNPARRQIRKTSIMSYL